ncbi:MAG: major capsid protein [Microcystis sp. M54BS1]|uniref:hypothetical protein n=1 Tax=unclassified Microcystis TaxID=2643300 RepID=UPI0025795C05|nr:MULTISPECIES: hypothetical protein [unclassified Microcystis]MCA2539676.1 major capsid protein [Microcystis sp. M54BS1]MCA2596211.1 major capsid protein [Microcystis sp. M38BS1]MCA2612851.1 major capsid protein [Microcystis sp. M27BS1]MCA2504920.1 major capsid protein [Microcystis sp. M62BS1]MCA2513639.1 major capsid protein [Microcystis sp. M60BS1]
MVKSLLTLATELKADGAFDRIMLNSLSQLGSVSMLNMGRELMGARLLPDEMRRRNEYKEQAVRYRTVVATDGTPYTPAQLVKGAMVGSMKVELGHHDVKVEMDASQLEALEEMILMKAETQGESAAELLAQQELLNWVDTSVNLSLQFKKELQRWQAIVDAQVSRVFPGGTTETVSFPNPTGSRFNAGGTWSNDNYDPMEDIIAACNRLWGLGFNIDKMVTSTNVVSIMALNEKIRTRAGYLSTSGGAVLPVGIAGYGLPDVNSAIRRSGSGNNTLPDIMTYDLQYPTQTGTQYFLPRNCFVIIGSTGENRQLLVDERIFPLYNTLGYYGVGRVEGYKKPGPIIHVDTYDKKPVSIVGEGYMTGFPVITNPEAICVIRNIS